MNCLISLIPSRSLTAKLSARLKITMIMKTGTLMMTMTATRFLARQRVTAAQRKRKHAKKNSRKFIFCTQEDENSHSCDHGSGETCTIIFNGNRA